MSKSKEKIKKTDLTGLSLVSDHAKEIPPLAKDKHFAQTFIPNDGELVIHFRNFQNKKRWFIFSVVEVNEKGNLLVPAPAENAASNVNNNLQNQQPEE